MLSAQERNARILAELQKHNPGATNFSYDFPTPCKPVGHAAGVLTSTQIVRGYRNSHRTGSQHVEPDQVITVLRDAGIKRWVLMGLYGYVGYLAEPRATQDVDILVHRDELAAATSAILKRWPTLVPEVLDVVTRFRDPGEVAIDGQMKQVIDLMLPSNSCYELVLDTEFHIDEATNHRIPTIEAACAAKFSAMVSPFRSIARKSIDAGDFRNIVVPNQDIINRQRLAELGELVYAGGSVEILEYLDLAIAEKPFPV